MKHGGNLSEAIGQYGGNPEDWLDLSTGINPSAYPLPEDISKSLWQRLPDSEEENKLLDAARTAYGVPGHLALAAAPGTQILLSLLPLVLPEGPVAIWSPTYPTHFSAWTRENKNPLQFSAVDELPGEATNIIVVNPNNPDGSLLEPEELMELAKKATERGGYLVVDEAFADVVPEMHLLPHLKDENVMVLRSFGKFYGLAGLRLGFAAGPGKMIQAIKAKLECWSVSGPAIEIGITSLKDMTWRQETINGLRQHMGELCFILMGSGLQVRGGTPLFVLAEAPNAHEIHEELAKQHIWTRIFENQPTWIRFGLPGDQDKLMRLQQALVGKVKTA